MKYKIKILSSAWEELKMIQDYYSIQFDSRTAIKVIDHILSTIERLEDFPGGGFHDTRYMAE